MRQIFNSLALVKVLIVVMLIRVNSANDANCGSVQFVKHKIRDISIDVSKTAVSLTWYEAVCCCLSRGQQLLSPSTVDFMDRVGSALGKIRVIFQYGIFSLPIVQFSIKQKLTFVIEPFGWCDVYAYNGSWRHFSTGRKIMENLHYENRKQIPLPNKCMEITPTFRLHDVHHCDYKYNEALICEERKTTPDNCHRESLEPITLQPCNKENVLAYAKENICPRRGIHNASANLKISSLNEDIFDDFRLLEKHTFSERDSSEGNLGDHILAYADSVDNLTRRIRVNTPQLEVTKIVEKVVGVFSGVLNNGRLWGQLKNKDTKSRVFAEFFIKMESIMLSLADKVVDNKGSTIKAFRPSRNSSGDDIILFLGSSAATVDKENNEIERNNVNFSDGDSHHGNIISVELTRENEFSHRNATGIYFVGIMTQPTFMYDAADNRAASDDINGSLLNTSEKINGKIISFTFNESLQNKNITINITFSKIKPDILESSTCVFWNEVNKDWSKNGCKRIHDTQYLTDCQCNHLSTFTVMTGYNDSLVLRDSDTLTELKILENETSSVENESKCIVENRILDIAKTVRNLTTKIDASIPKSEAIKIADRAANVFSNVLNNKQEWASIKNKEEKSNVFTKFYKTIEFAMLPLAEKIAYEGNNTPIQYRSSNFNSSANDLVIFMGASTVTLDNKTTQMKRNKIYVNDEVFPYRSTISIELKSESNRLFQNESPLTYVATMIQPTVIQELVGSPTASDYTSGSDLKIPKQINGKLISFTFNSAFENRTKNVTVKVEFANNVVTVYRHHKPAAFRRNLLPGETPKAISGSTMCVYWDETEKVWSAVGCKTINISKYTTECECNHLSSFTVLTGFHKYTGKDWGLQLITWILCSLSILCLTLTLIVFSLEKKRSDEKTITTQLCIMLIMGNALLLVGEKENFKFSDLVCTICGSLTHFVWLCVFGWMAVEGIHLYNQVIKVFPPKSDHLFIFYCGIGYGIPLVIVGTTMLTGYMLQDDGFIYVGEMFCWLTENYIWWFMGPAILVVVGNTCMLIAAVYLASRRRTRMLANGSNKKEEELKRNSFKKLVKGTMSLTCILGVTWLLGFFTLVDFQGHVIFSYAFTITNASQGMFIFIFRICLNDQTRLTMSKIVGGISFSMISSNSGATGTSTVQSSSGFAEKDNNGVAQGKITNKNKKPAKPRVGILQRFKRSKNDYGNCGKDLKADSDYY